MMKTSYQPLAVAIFSALSGCFVDATHETYEHLRSSRQTLIPEIVSASFSLIGTNTVIRTGDMPAGWYDSRTGDVPITVTWSGAKTGCKASQTGTFGSDNASSLAQLWSRDGEFIGVSWEVRHDLSGFENHWHNFVACDGSIAVIGCQSPRTVKYTLSVADHCATNSAACATSGSVSLPSIRDADELETNCPPNCAASLRACIAACQTACPTRVSSCSRCCECDCKDAIHEQTAACPAPQASCYVSASALPACL